MSGLFDQFREKVFSSVWRNAPEKQSQVQVDDKIALGVLLWEVAQADKQFLPEEKEKLIEVLQKYGNYSEDEMTVILQSVEEASKQKIDLYTFTQELVQSLSYDFKILLVEQLFRVACIDGELAHEEHELIRRISGLFRLDHKDFINAKIKVKKEYGMNTF